MKGPLEISQLLLATGVVHEMVHLPHVITSADELPDALGLDAADCVAVRLYLLTAAHPVRRPVGSRPPVAVLVPAGQWPAASAVAALFGAPNAIPADPDLVSAITDFRAALVSPLGLPRDVPLVIDAPLAARDVVYCPTGDGGSAVGLHVRDLARLTAARVAAVHRDRLGTAVPPGIGVGVAAPAQRTGGSIEQEPEQWWASSGR